MESILKNNLSNVAANIEAACMRVNRPADEVTLIAVSKTKPIPMLEEVYEAGVRHFGENKVQELCDKYPKLPKDIKWHLIGHLQRNKVKYIVDKVALIHSVDSYRLAVEISKEAQKRDCEVSVLIQVNVALEESKFGFSVDETLDNIIKIAQLPNIKIKGLMTIAPFVEDPEENRMYFKKLKQLSVDIGMKKVDNVDMSILSMGMTGDYQVAIEEGASMVRVGTGIFGERDYNTNF